jgi:hypothetical protein
MPVTQVNGYDEFKKLAGVLGKDAKFVYFRGSNEAGKSWCPDCRKCMFTIQRLLLTLIFQVMMLSKES